MTEKGPSQTAIRVAMRRAAHCLLDAERALTHAGFSSVEHFGAEVFDRYLRGRTDGARLPDHFRMAKATTR
jgi:hypothetical protein